MLTAHTPPDTDTAQTPDTDVKSLTSRPTRRLTPTQRVQIRKRTEEGWSSRRIAEEIGCWHTTVLDAQRDVFAEAKEIIRSAMPRLANVVGKTKNPTVALKVLQAHEVVPKDEVSTGLTVQIGINLADLSPCIEAQVSSAQTLTEYESDK